MICIDLDLYVGCRHNLEEIGRVVVAEVNHNLALRKETSLHCIIARVGESIGLGIK